MSKNIQVEDLYDNLHILGEGGFGLIIKGESKNTGQTVIIKVNLKENMPPEKILACSREQNMLMMCRGQPNLVGLIEVLNDGKNEILIMDFIDGECLETSFLHKRRFTIAECKSIGLDICRALSHFHQNKIVHRDVKPGNIILNPDFQAYLCDYGIAVPFSESHSINGFTLGNVPYISPEAIMGDYLDARSDIYALGAVLFELITGKKTYSHRSVPKICSKIIKGCSPKFSLIPKCLRPVIQKCLALYPWERFQNVWELAEALK